MKGKFYGIGVGPGDQELITLKAVRILEQCHCVVIPKAEGRQSTAFQIAKTYLKQDCEILEISFKMTRKKEERIQSRLSAVEEICAVLNQGKDTAFLTLGDPSIYSTCMYVCSVLSLKGYEREIVPGVPSFCAAAACLKTSIAEEDENFAVLSFSDETEKTKKIIKEFDSVVFMKSAKKIKEIKELLQKSGSDWHMSGVVNCGMEGEQVFSSEEEWKQEDFGYFTTLLCKRKKEENWFQS